MGDTKEGKLCGDSKAGPKRLTDNEEHQVPYMTQNGAPKDR